MDDLFQFIDSIIADHVDDDGKLDEFGVLALALIGIPIFRRVCEVYSKIEINENLPSQSD